MGKHQEVKREQNRRKKTKLTVGFLSLPMFPPPFLSLVNREKRVLLKLKKK